MIIKLQKHLKIQHVLLVLSIFLALVLFRVSVSEASAACAVDTSRGVVTQTFNVPADQVGTYRVWARMAAGTAADKDSFYLEVDGGECVTFGGTGLAATGWKWVDYRDGSTSAKVNTASLSAGNHTVKMIGLEDSVKIDKLLFVRSTSCVPTDMAGNPCLPDTTPPTVSVTPPTAPLSGTQALLNATASDNDSLATVQFFIDNQPLTPADNQAPYTYSLDTTKYSNGSHQITAEATDMSGNKTKSSIVSVTISNTVPDTTKPVVNLTDPINGASIPEGQYTIKTTASDNVAVKHVIIKLDGQQVGNPITTAPYNATVTLSAGSHTIEATAVDTSNINSDPKTATITVTSTPLPTKQCDFVKTPSAEANVINMKDLGIILINWRKTVTPNTNGDCTGDGQVTGRDLSILLGGYGK